jgi:hypothetical protein
MVRPVTAADDLDLPTQECDGLGKLVKHGALVKHGGKEDASVLTA